jgi:hypothetical protein
MQVILNFNSAAATGFSHNITLLQTAISKPVQLDV